MNIKIISLICTALLLSACTNGPAPFGSIPTEAQVEWQKMEYNMFIHFGPNTFTNVEWGDGSDKEVVYDPQKRIGVAISKLGASKAIAMGAYAFALNQIDK